MATGDAVSIFLGTAAENRQPSAGVEEQISFLGKPGRTDAIQYYDGSNTVTIFNGALDTGSAGLNAGVSTITQPFNMALNITNRLYLRKTGTTDRIYAGGIQVG